MANIQNALTLGTYSQTATLGPQVFVWRAPATVGAGAVRHCDMRLATSNSAYFVEIKGQYGVSAGNGNSAYSVHRFVGHLYNNGILDGTSTTVAQAGTDATDMDWDMLAVGSNNDLRFRYTNNSGSTVYQRVTLFTCHMYTTFVWQS